MIQRKRRITVKILSVFARRAERGGWYMRSDIDDGHRYNFQLVKSKNNVLAQPTRTDNEEGRGDGGIFSWGRVEMRKALFSFLI